jgi:hypothetical protein
MLWPAELVWLSGVEQSGARSVGPSEPSFAWLVLRSKIFRVYAKYPGLMRFIIPAYILYVVYLYWTTPLAPYLHGPR